MEERCLEGIRVCDFTRVLAGPYLTRHMHDLGAEVIKIERPVAGDDSRYVPHIIEPGYSGYFMQQNCGKKDISIDLKHPRGREIVRDLVRISDVVVENFKPGVMADLELDYVHLREVNRGIIMCSISGWGQDGPYAQRPGEVTTTTAISGANDPAGDPDGPPASFRHAFGDMNASAHALAAIGAALYYRERTGIGQYIDISILDCLFSINDMDVQNYILSHGEIEPIRYRHHHPIIVPSGDFLCRDGRWVCVEAHDDAGWARLAGAMGKPELADDQRFQTADRRRENQGELYGLLTMWIEGFASADEALSILRAHRVIAAPILSIAEAVDHPQIKAREMLIDVEDPVVGKTRLTNSPYKFSETISRITGSPPLLGQHNEEVLTTLLGYPEDEVARLMEEGVIYTSPSKTIAT
jgi:crotonobetainyl-CoA:carnitine CoA-transferase CaiB-like acyl-CoA transferase